MSEAIGDAQAWGLPADLVASLDRKEAGFPVWPENMGIVDAFMAVTSQFRPISLAQAGLHWLGMNYAGVKAGLDMAGIVLTPAEWAGLQIMERAATSALNGYRG